MDYNGKNAADEGAYAQSVMDYERMKAEARAAIFGSATYARITKELETDPLAYVTVTEKMHDWCNEIAAETGLNRADLVLQLGIILSEPWRAAYGRVPSQWDEYYKRRLALPRPYPAPTRTEA